MILITASLPAASVCQQSAACGSNNNGSIIMIDHQPTICYF
jgi:hypothetical protein